jgi:RNA polymerase sigma-70 factor (ECF subfamily)
VATLDNAIPLAPTTSGLRLGHGVLIDAAPADPGADASLVEAARAGDRTAFGRLYHRYARVVHGLLLARVPRTEVDDLVQDVFLRALGQLHSLRDNAYFPGWLCAIARNRANDFYRRRRPTDELPDALPGAGRADDPEARAALEALRELPEAYRETLILRLVEGLTGQEIADRTGLTPGSVRVNLHRGMKLLREKLGRTES